MTNLSKDSQTLTRPVPYISIDTAKTPEVPFGSTFVALTKNVVINTGGNTCRLFCSVEAEFPNGPPMVARQIQSGMRAGTTESFIRLGETITKYANAFS